MSGFLKEYPQYSEFNYKWNLSVEKRIIMLADAPRVEYKEIEKSEEQKNAKVKEEYVTEGNLDDFLSDFAVPVNKK